MEMNNQLWLSIEFTDDLPLDVANLFGQLFLRGACELACVSYCIAEQPQ